MSQFHCDLVNCSIACCPLNGNSGGVMIEDCDSDTGEDSEAAGDS